MKIAEKDFKEYWKAGKFPFIVLALFGLGGLAYALIDYASYVNLFGTTGYIVILIVFGYLGWSAVADHKFSVRHAAWSGAVIGVMYGLLSAVIGIIIVNTVPNVVEVAYAAAKAQAHGAQISRDMIETMVGVGAYFSLVLSPIITGLLGAGLSALGGWIGSKKK